MENPALKERAETAPFEAAISLSRMDLLLMSEIAVKILLPLLGIGLS